MATSAVMVEQSGGGKKDVKRAQVHEKNVSMTGNKIFNDNFSNIMAQAVLQNYNILDCVVVIDLCKAPPSIEVTVASDFLSKGMYTDDNSSAHTKRIIERNRENGALTVACISIGVYAGDDDANAILLKTFPGEAAPMGSWTAAQADMERSMGFSLEDLRRHPKQIEGLLEDLRRAKE